MADSVFSRRTFKGSYFEESRIIVRNIDVRFTTVVEQVGGYFLPWSFWQRSWCIMGSVWFFRCLWQVGHVVTMSSICLLIPGHQTGSRALLRHLRIPWWPAWILSNVSKGRDEGMISLESFIRRPLWNVIQALSGRKALSAEFSFDLSGHPSVLNCSFRHTSSSCWWSQSYLI